MKPNYLASRRFELRLPSHRLYFITAIIGLLLLQAYILAGIFGTAYLLLIEGLVYLNKKYPIVNDTDRTDNEIDLEIWPGIVKHEMICLLLGVITTFSFFYFDLEHPEAISTICLSMFAAVFYTVIRWKRAIQ